MSERLEAQEYFVYFKLPICTIRAKDPPRGGKTFQEYAKLKRERGEFHIHPAVAPVSLIRVDSD